MGCLIDCSPDLLTMVEGDDCTPGRMNGGIHKLVFMKCDKSFEDVSGGDVTDLALWATMITNADIIVSSPILGSMPAASVQRLRTSSCSPETVVGGTKTINFEDYNAELLQTFHIKWWKQIQLKYAHLKLLYVTCDEYVYGPFDNGTWSIDVSEVREQTKESPTKIAGSISIAQYELTVPQLVPGILDIIGS